MLVLSTQGSESERSVCVRCMKHAHVQIRMQVLPTVLVCSAMHELLIVSVTAVCQQCTLQTIVACKLAIQLFRTINVARSGASALHCHW
jgi:hypothetical protein